MPLSKNQKAFRDHLLKQLGFTEGEILDSFCRAVDSRYDGETHEVTFKDKKLDKWITAQVAFTIIDLLMDELNIRKQKKRIDKASVTSTISATDLAAYTFCPASYAIAKTFVVESTEEMDRGTEQHERQWLLNDTFQAFRQSDEHSVMDRYITRDNSAFFRELKESKLIFAGHNGNEKKFFYDKTGKFVGQPDYVFQNKHGQNFIVEEKFQFSKKDFTNYNNHKVQLASYLFGIDEFNAQYGYLVYWQEYWQKNTGVCSSQDRWQHIDKCEVHRLEKSEAMRAFIQDIFKSVNSLKKGNILKFNTSKINPNKCIRCSSRSLCGHKTGRFEDISYPYQDRKNIWN